MGVIVSGAVRGIVIYRLRLRRLLSAAVFPLRVSLRVPLYAASMRGSLHDGSLLCAGLSDSQTRLPARVPASLPGQTRMPNRLSACRPAGMPANDACYPACGLNR